MEIRLHDPDAAGVPSFARHAARLLEADPVRHTVELTVLRGLRSGAYRAVVLLTAHDADHVVGAALGASGRPLLVAGLPPPCAAAADAAVPDVDAVAGPLPEVEAFAAARVARTGARTRPGRRTRLFALEELVVPQGVPGASRAAVRAESALLGAWWEAFESETTTAPARGRTGAEAAAQAFAAGRDQVLWVVGGEPRALAVVGPRTAGTARSGPVYPPPEHRGRGYGSAVTAAAAARSLAAGARDVVLFTDLANPTTNHIYPELGFRPVSDAREVRFA
ncbi:MAG: GNAT family N-acetyltransferase [Pseudonocardia sp.]|nr:GNAT family N-acetyltransferase [Pseudonocardia sp.]